MSDIREWLTELDLERYADAFEENDVDHDVIADLSEEDLEKLGVSMGHRKRLLRALAEPSEPSDQYRTGSLAKRSADRSQ